MSTIAIVKIGGKQYKVQEGTVLKVEKIKEKEGEVISLPVLFVGDEDKVQVGNPLVDKVVVEAKVLKQGKGKKVVGIKHKPKKRQLKKFGHRQPFTEIEIVKIGG